MDSRRNGSIHDWMYRVVSETCGDRGYLYRVFVEHFTGLMRQIYAEGRISDSGSYRFPGLQSGLEAEIHWQLAKRLNIVGPNRIELSCSFRDQGSGKAGENWKAEFELSSGERIY